MLNELLAMQKNFCEYAKSEDNNDSLPWSSLFFMPQGEFFDIIYSGFGDDQPSMSTEELRKDQRSEYYFASFLEWLSRQEIANRICSLRFDGDDEGANGTQSWLFQRLINSDVVFPNLKSFSVRLTKPGDHNTCIIEGAPGDFDESGSIAKLVAKMPNLRNLEVPSAPDKSFFEMGSLPLWSLTVQAGYDHQNFIDNMAESDCFPHLHALDYSDYQTVFTEMAGTETQFASYKKLFESKLFAEHPHFQFKLRYSILTRQQLSALMTIKNDHRARSRDVQFLYIDIKDGEYIEPHPVWS